MNEVKNYEESLKRLEEIVAKLESGRLTLEESISLYGEGVKISEGCAKALDAAELYVKNVAADEKTADDKTSKDDEI